MAELDVMAIELAEQIPCHPAHFSMVLRGHRPASAQLRARVAEILEAHVDDLFDPAMVTA